MGSLTDILSGNAEDAAKQQLEGIMLGTKAAGKRLGEGLQGYKDYGTKALGEFDPYTGVAQNAYSTYGNALGLNGAEGTAAAQSAYTTSPGYQFQMDQGLQALERSASSRGMLASGNTSADILGYSQGLASQDYGSWLDRLNGLGSQGIGMAGARAGIQTGIGGKAYETGDSLADLAWNAATSAGNVAAQKESAEGQGLLGGISLGTKLLGSAFGAGGF
jgi:hypothetical protein